VTRLLVVGRDVDDAQRRKLGALAAEFDLRVLPWRDRSRSGALDYALLPARVARALRRFRPDAMLVQGAHETALALAGRRLAGTDTKIVLDVHGDWRAPARLYGSPLRALLAPAADRLALAALRRVDGVRSITPYTTRLLRDAGVEPLAEFPAFMELEPFLERPPRGLPERPRAVFIGVLERSKNVDGLLAAWPAVRRKVGDAELHLVGDGALRSLVERSLGDSVTWTPRLPSDGVATALDEAWCLVLPSHTEGMGRVAVEAFCRGRCVVGTRVGGIADLVKDGLSGLLVPPGDGDALAQALVRVLSDRTVAAALSEGARRDADAWATTPEEFAHRLRDLVEAVIEPESG
jgi:glycosyltransferase involved in cell wall biosynthesis